MTIHRRQDDPALRKESVDELEVPTYPKMPQQVRDQLEAYRDTYVRYASGERGLVFGQAHKLKCLDCDLHFVVLTMQSFWLDRNRGFCPECGGRKLLELRTTLLRLPIGVAQVGQPEDQ